MKPEQRGRRRKGADLKGRMAQYDHDRTVPMRAEGVELRGSHEGETGVVGTGGNGEARAGDGEGGARGRRRLLWAEPTMISMLSRLLLSTWRTVTDVQRSTYLAELVER